MILRHKLCNLTASAFCVQPRVCMHGRHVWPQDSCLSLLLAMQGEQAQAAEEAPKTWGQRLLGGFIFRSSSKAPKESSAGRSPGTQYYH